MGPASRQLLDNVALIDQFAWCERPEDGDRELVSRADDCSPFLKVKLAFETLTAEKKALARRSVDGGSPVILGFAAYSRRASIS
jgi:hypothetical protein